MFHLELGRLCALQEEFEPPLTFETAEQLAKALNSRENRNRHHRVTDDVGRHLNGFVLAQDYALGVGDRGVRLARGAYFLSMPDGLRPLTDDEAALLVHVERWGSEGYPIQRRSEGRSWHIGPWRSWRGFPATYPTKRAAVEQFERWKDLALERWGSMKRERPHLMLTGVGVRDAGA
jgi:hypothetical protein